MGESDETVQKYAWVKNIEAWTIAVSSGPAVDDVLMAYGGDPSAPLGDLTFAEVDELRAGADVEFYVQFVRHRDVVVAVENDGYSGAFPEVVRRCTGDGGWFFSVYWNIHAAGMVTQAIDGVITARFESLYPLAPEVQPWERRPEWAIGPAVEPELSWQVCMASLERQTGVVVEPEWLTEPHPTYRIPEPYGHYQGADGADRIG